MHRRLLVPFTAVGLVLVASSAGFACTVFLGEFTVKGVVNGGPDPVGVTGTSYYTPLPGGFAVGQSMTNIIRGATSVSAGASSTGRTVSFTLKRSPFGNQVPDGTLLYLRFWNSQSGNPTNGQWGYSTHETMSPYGLPGSPPYVHKTAHCMMGSGYIGAYLKSDGSWTSQTPGTNVPTGAKSWKVGDPLAGFASGEVSGSFILPTGMTTTLGAGGVPFVAGESAICIGSSNGDDSLYGNQVPITIL